MKLLVIPNRIMYQNDSQESKILCMNKFFELFHQCKIHEKLKQSFPLIYKDLIDYSKTDDTENLIKFLINSKNAENYMLYKMRNRVKKDMNYV